MSSSTRLRVKGRKRSAVGCAGAHSWAVKIHGLHLGFLAQAKGKRYARAFTDVFACCERLVVLRMLSESSYEKEET